MNSRFSSWLQLVLCGLLLGLLPPMASTWPTNRSFREQNLPATMATDLSSGDFIAKRPVMRWATLIEREDCVIHATGGGRASDREPSRLGSRSERHPDRSWKPLRDTVQRQRYKKETSLPFPEDAYFQVQP